MSAFEITRNILAAIGLFYVAVILAAVIQSFREAFREAWDETKRDRGE